MRCIVRRKRIQVMECTPTDCTLQYFPPTTVGDVPINFRVNGPYTIIVKYKAYTQPNSKYPFKVKTTDAYYLLSNGNRTNIANSGHQSYKQVNYAMFLHAVSTFYKARKGVMENEHSVR